MVGTEADLNQRLPSAIHVCGSIDEALALNPSEIFRSADLLAIDGIAWRADLALIRTGLDPRRRARKDPWHKSPIAPEVTEQVEIMKAQADEIFGLLYPGFTVTGRISSFRPMITGPEPMHFDTKITDTPLVVSFINVSTAPRVYRIGPRFKDLDPALICKMWRTAQARGDLDVSYVARASVNKRKPPFGVDMPTHLIRFAPGAIWFFDAKMLAHQVVYGEGAVAIAWVVEGSDAMQQRDILRGLAA